MATRDSLDGLPRVSVSAFKVNPSAYLVTGALVTSHGKPRAAFVPIEGQPREGSKLNDIKAQLRMLSRMIDEVDVEDELAELAAGRDAEIIEPRQ